MIDVKKINEYSWMIEKEGNMKVPVKIFASDELIEKIKTDKSLQQAKNMACLPGIKKHVVVCPDAHQGYGACIGGVAAFDAKTGIISPGLTGFDINCGVRLLRTNLRREDIKGKVQELLEIQWESSTLMVI